MLYPLSYEGGNRVGTLAPGGAGPGAGNPGGWPILR